MTTNGLDGQVAIVTGAVRGIGRATVEALLDLGAAVALVDLDAPALVQLATDLADAGHRVAAIATDLGDFPSLDTVLPRVESALGAVSILVNNAGILSAHHLLDVELPEWERVLAVNLTAPWRLTQLVGRSMIANSIAGRIVNVSSSAAFRARSAYGPYGVSKAAIVALTKGAAAELGGYGISVNAVAPGPTATDMLGGVPSDDPALVEMVTSGPFANLLHRVSEPADVANVIAFLCSAGSRQITGQVIHTSAGSVV